jgi:hypothetical protein
MSRTTIGKWAGRRKESKGETVRSGRETYRQIFLYEQDLGHSANEIMDGIKCMFASSNEKNGDNYICIGLYSGIIETVDIWSLYSRSESPWHSDQGVGLVFIWSRV